MSLPDLTRRPQMPESLTRLDDPWGITWRVVNAIRRASLRRALRFLWGVLEGVTYERPIFVVGPSRSGTTLVFHVLRASPTLCALPGEGHDIWRMFHHPRYSGWRSDAVGAEDVRPGEGRLVAARFYARAGRGRLLEKTPENALRIPYLLALFPDARFVAVHRHPCDVISSLINAWRHPDGRFRSYYVPEPLSIPGYAPRRRWCFGLIDGWRELRSAPLPEIAFAQWRAHLVGLSRGRTLVPAARWHDVWLQDLREAPGPTLESLCRAVDVPIGPQTKETLSRLLAEPVNALTPPGRDKWRRDNREALEPLLPRIAELAPLAGFEVDSASGVARRRAPAPAGRSAGDCADGRRGLSMSAEPRCQICAGARRFRYRWRGFRTFECDRCGTETAEPQPDAGQLARFYEESSGKKMHAPDRQLRLVDFAVEGYLRRFARHGVGPPLRLLDLGGGVGHYSRAAADRGVDAYLVDWAEDALAFARDALGVRRMVRGDVERCHDLFPEGFFDVVLSRHTLEHLRDPLEHLRGVARLLRDDGLLQLETPDVASREQLRHLGVARENYRILRRDNPELTAVEAARWALCKSASGINPPKHLWGFTPEGLRRLLDACGFEVLELERSPAGDAVHDPLFYERPRSAGWRARCLALWVRSTAFLFRGRGMNLAVLARRR